MKFKELKTGWTFDWISPKPGAYNSFYARCVKMSPRTYADQYGIKYQVGSINAEVHHVSTAPLKIED